VEVHHTVDDIPQLRGKDEPYDSVVVLFPAEGATDINTMTEQELRAIKKVVLIDSTWSQTRHYIRSEQIRSLKMVKI